MPIIDGERMPAKTRAFLELGSSGLKTSGGQVFEDFIPELKTLRQRVKVYKEMVMDPVVSAILFAIEMYLRQVEWSVEPASKNAADKDAAKFLWDSANGTSHTWQDFISEAMSMLPFGFSVFETVYKRAPNGRIVWKKHAVRAQDTIWEWEFDQNGGLKGFWQHVDWAFMRGGVPAKVFIPIEKALLFRTTSALGNPEGKSVLRGAYRPWRIKKRLEITEAIGIERDLAGYPVIKAPDEIFGESPEQKARLNLAQTVVARVRRDEQMGAVIPESWEFELLSSQGSRGVDTDKVIGRYDARIAQSVLSDIVLMGHGSGGSYALAEIKNNIFSEALKAWLDSIEAVLNRYAVPRLFSLNAFPGITGMPKFRHGPVSQIDPLRLANILYRLKVSGFIIPTRSIEESLLRKLGLPITVGDEIESEESEEAGNGNNDEGRGNSGDRGVRTDNDTRPESVAETFDVTPMGSSGTGSQVPSGVGGAIKSMVKKLISNRAIRH